MPSWKARNPKIIKVTKKVTPGVGLKETPKRLTSPGKTAVFASKERPVLNFACAPENFCEISH